MPSSQRKTQNLDLTRRVAYATTMTAELPYALKLLTKLAPPGSRLLVAVSGGPDSQALLQLIINHREPCGWPTVWAAGIDHGLRPEAPLELDVAQALAERHGIIFVRRAVTVAARGNLMAEARKARYQALEAIAVELGADRIVVAHTATDQVESILLNLARGAGLKGAAGIRTRRGRIIRPLLTTSRSDILAYLAANQITYATDPTNSDLKHARAVIRHQVLPALRSLNPALERAFGRFAEQARGDDSVLTTLARREVQERLGVARSLSVRRFPNKPTPLCFRVLKEWLALFDLNASRDTLVRLFATAAGHQGALSLDGQTVRRDQNRLWLVTAEPYDIPLHLGTPVPLPELSLELLAETLPVSAEIARDEKIEVAFDADCPHLPLRVRCVRRGDRFTPFGGVGHTKVSDLFINAKVPRALRANWPVVICGEEILWVVGLRRSNLAPVTLATRNVLRLTVSGVGALPQGSWRTRP